MIDVGSEWRTFSNEKAGVDPSRVGGPENPLLSGGDLSTMIGPGTGSASFDAFGSEFVATVGRPNLINFFLQRQNTRTDEPCLVRIELSSPHSVKSHPWPIESTCQKRLSIALTISSNRCTMEKVSRDARTMQKRLHVSTSLVVKRVFRVHSKKSAPSVASARKKSVDASS